VVLIDCVFFALTGAAIFVLRRKRPSEFAVSQMPGYPVAPLVFILGEVAVIAGAYMDPAVRQAALIGLGWIAVGAVLYAVRFRRGNAG
jgi:basic amino acid/polyamine antiporter, APA family